MSAGKSGSITITISEQERAELSDILSKIVEEAHLERRRTEDPDYQDSLDERIAHLENLVRKFGGTP